MYCFFFYDIAYGQEKMLLPLQNCSNFRTKFLKSEYMFGTDGNMSLTTFYVYVYDFKPPLWIQISFSQYPKLNLQQFFITFSSYVFSVCYTSHWLVKILIFFFFCAFQMFFAFVISSCYIVEIETKIWHVSEKTGKIYSILCYFYLF